MGGVGGHGVPDLLPRDVVGFEVVEDVFAVVKIKIVAIFPFCPWMMMIKTWQCQVPNG